MKGDGKGTLQPLKGVLEVNIFSAACLPLTAAKSSLTYSS